LLYGLNQTVQFILMVENDTVEGSHYLRDVFNAEPGCGVRSVNFDCRELLSRATR
jgi:hypothetical protein